MPAKSPQRKYGLTMVAKFVDANADRTASPPAQSSLTSAHAFAGGAPLRSCSVGLWRRRGVPSSSRGSCPCPHCLDLPLDASPDEDIARRGRRLTRTSLDEDVAGRGRRRTRPSPDEDVARRGRRRTRTLPDEDVARQGHPPVPEGKDGGRPPPPPDKGILPRPRRRTGDVLVPRRTRRRTDAS